MIIPAFSARGTIGACVDAVLAFPEAPFEIIVVDDHSRDDTADLARAKGCTVLSTEKRSGPARARNLGAAHARGDILVFLDADVRPHPDAIRRLAAHLEDTQVGVAIGAYDDTPADPGFFSRYRNLLHCHTHRLGRANASTFWAGCGAIRRDVFHAFGGFDERYERSSIEDIEFGMRLTSAGVRILLDPQVPPAQLPGLVGAKAGVGHEEEVVA